MMVGASPHPGLAALLQSRHRQRQDQHAEPRLRRERRGAEQAIAERGVDDGENQCQLEAQPPQQEGVARRPGGRAGRRGSRHKERLATCMTTMVARQTVVASRYSGSRRPSASSQCQRPQAAGRLIPCLSSEYVDEAIEWSATRARGLLHLCTQAPTITSRPTLPEPGPNPPQAVRSEAAWPPPGKAPRSASCRAPSAPSCSRCSPSVVMPASVPPWSTAPSSTGGCRRRTSCPGGIHDRQAPGRYRIEESAGPRCFSWVNGPQALKPLLFAPREVLWRAERQAGGGLDFNRCSTHFLRTRPSRRPHRLAGGGAATALALDAALCRRPRPARPRPAADRAGRRHAGRRRRGAGGRRPQRGGARKPCIGSPIAIWRGWKPPCRRTISVSRRRSASCGHWASCRNPWCSSPWKSTNATSRRRSAPPWHVACRR